MSTLLSLLFLAAIAAIGYGVWKATFGKSKKGSTGTGIGGGTPPEEPTGPVAEQ